MILDQFLRIVNTITQDKPHSKIRVYLRTIRTADDGDGFTYDYDIDVTPKIFMEDGNLIIQGL